MRTIGITGGTGFVGRRLTASLVQSGNKVVIFTRKGAQDSDNNNITYAHWDPYLGRCDQNAIASVDAVVNLAGAGVADKRWSKERKAEIRKSRVTGTAFLVEQLKQHNKKCKTFVSASAIGIYGADAPGQPPFNEDNSANNDFLGNVCQEWELESLKAASYCRTVILRIGIVLGKEAGAFPKFAEPMAFGIMPILGSGSQMTSWIAVDDLVRMFVFAIDNAQIVGVYNAVAPHPVSQRQLMQTIANAKGGIRIPVPAPSFLLKLMLGEMSIEILKSATVSSKKIAQHGFEFSYPSIKGAIEHILR